MIQILPVSDKKLLKKFINFPQTLYKDDKNYVPELFIAQRDLLTPGKHLFFIKQTRYPCIYKMLPFFCFCFIVQPEAHVHKYDDGNSRPDGLN